MTFYQENKVDQDCQRVLYYKVNNQNLEVYQPQNKDLKIFQQIQVQNDQRKLED